MDAAERIDRFQRRRRWASVPVAIVYKFVDDQGVYLAAIMTHYLFVAIFPLLLLSTTLLGFVLSGDSQIAQTLLNSAVAQFPIVGTQLSSPSGLQGSIGAVIVGLTASLYGVLGLGQAVQNTLWVAWAQPRNARPNPFLSRLRSALLISGFGLFMLLVSATSLTVQRLAEQFESFSRWITAAAGLGTVALISLAVAFLYRLASLRVVAWPHAIAGGAVVGLGFSLLQQLGGLYVGRILSQVTDVNAVFALTLGLTALLFLAANVFVLGTETCVVLARLLYPRALLTPFTDAVSLTEADRRAYRYYARMQRHKGFESVEVVWHDLEDIGPAPRDTPIGGPATIGMTLAGEDDGDGRAVW